MFVAILVVSVIVALALPMKAIRVKNSEQAHGDTDNDKVYDDVVWAIDQSGTLTQIK